MDREEIEQDLIRARLRAEGFHFCDEAVAPAPAEQELIRLTREQLRFKAAFHFHESQVLLEAGISSSSCDHPSQAIGNTLSDDNEFWSSTGSEDTYNETLLYRLRHPLCKVLNVQLAIYKARYQFGSPVYPPRAVSFAIGSSPRQLKKVPGVYPVRAHDKPQSFPLPAEAPVGRYLQVTFHGKQQRQLQDLDFYIALRRIWVFGCPVPYPQLRSIACSPGRTTHSLENGFCLPGNSEPLTKMHRRNKKVMPRSMLTAHDEEFYSKRYQGEGRVAFDEPTQHKKMPMFTWHDVPEGDTASIGNDARE